MRPVRDTIPVNLIAGIRRALVVGYGKVGQRKVRFLLDCGAKVTVIAPAPHDPAPPAVTFIERAFEPGDCEGALVAFACTDDKHVNRAVLEDARRYGVPCCCADMNWADGDFTTPAVARVAGATVAVSTSGASCATAKELRRAVAEFLVSRSEGRIVMLGTNDGMLSTERRAAFHLPPEARREMARLLYGMKGVEGLVVLNTCNRVEIAVHGSVDLGSLKRLMRFHRLAEGEYFVLEGADAFRHAVMVAAGLESAWAGEFHVVSQVKDALAESAAADMLSGRLKGFFDDVLGTSKHVRRSFGDILDVKEVEATAVDYAATKVDLAKARIVVLGSGAVGSMIADLLKGRDVRVVHHGEAIPQCDALFCTLAAGEPAVTAPIPGCRLVVDLGMPPNCAPCVGAVSLDDLKNWRRSQTGALDEAKRRANAVISAALVDLEEAGHGF